MNKFLFVFHFFVFMLGFSQNKAKDISTDFKLGGSFEANANFEKQFEKDGITTYNYIGSKAYFIEKNEIFSINLVVFEAQVMGIEINFGNPFGEDNFENSEYVALKKALQSEFGTEANEKKSKNPRILSEMKWQNEGNDISFKRLQFEEKILGLLLISDINLTDKFIQNLNKKKK